MAKMRTTSAFLAEGLRGLQRMGWTQPARLWLWLWLGALLGGIIGCASSSSRSGGPAAGSDAGIEEVNVLIAPAALNFDGIPGPDGLSLRVYLGNPREAKYLPLPNGTLEVVMFDGILKPAEMASSQPLHVWSYPADELRAYGQKTSIGVSYVLTPMWGADRPTHNRVTVLVRCVSPQGKKTYSSPTIVFVPES